MSENNRKSQLEDSLLLVHASKVISYLPADISDFKKNNTVFTPELTDKLKARLRAANSTKSEDEIKEDLEELTYIINRDIDTSFEVLKTVSYFVRKVFKGDIPTQKQFGLNNMEESDKDPAKMIVFMRSLAETVNKYQTKLIVGGMSESCVALLQHMHLELSEANINLEMFRKEMDKLTQDRDEKMNALYELLLFVSDAARKIYADNPGQLSKYILPDNQSDNGQGNRI